MANNYGLLGTAAEGIRTGLQAYQTTQQMQRNNQVQNLALGLQQDDQGNLQYTPEKQQEIDNQRKLGGLVAQHQLDELDPNSQESQGLVAGYKQAGFNVPEGTSAAQAKELLPAYEAKGRLQALQASLNQKQDAQDNSKWADFATKINDPSSRALIGRYQQNLNKADTLNVLTNKLGMQEGETPPANETREQKIARFNNATPQQLYEAANAADQLVSNAQGSVYGADHMLPKTMDTGLANMKQYMPDWANGNKPSGANAGEFFMNFVDQANRERGYYQQARDQAVAGLSAGYSQLKKKDPDRWNALLGQTATSAPSSAQGLIQSGGQQQSGQGLVQPSAPTSDQSGMVKIQTPDGRIGSIPAANLQKALAAGAKAL